MEKLSIPQKYTDGASSFARAYKCHQLELRFEYGYDRVSGTVLIQVLDHREGINRFQAFIPQFPMPKGSPYLLEGMCGLLEMFKVIFLYAPAVLLRNIPQDDKKIQEDLSWKGKEFLNFMLMHYYSVCKYEYGYDYEQPCEANWPDSMYRTLYPLTNDFPR